VKFTEDVEGDCKSEDALPGIPAENCGCCY